MQMRRLALGSLIVIALVVTATTITARRGDHSLWPPAPGAPTTAVFVVSHGYHAGILLPREPLAEAAQRHGLDALRAVAMRFAGFDRLEIGWGDEDFYRAGSFDAWLGIRALLRPGNPSVLHVVGVNNDPRAAFAYSDLVRIDLGEESFERVAAKVDTTFARDGSGAPQDLGPGLYGTSRFFRANGAFHLFNVCNHWLADLIEAAGIPTAPVLATLPAGLLLDLRWRSGLAPLPAVAKQ